MTAAGPIIVRGAYFTVEERGVVLDEELASRFLAMCHELLSRKDVMGNIVLTEGVRAPAVAHRWSTAFHIRMRDAEHAIDLDEIRALDAGRDRDGNIWYQDGGSDLDIVENATQIWSGAFALEGYEPRDPRRVPSSSRLGVSRHVTGDAIDARIPWREADAWDARITELVLSFGLDRPLADEHWHFELADD